MAQLGAGTFFVELGVKYYQAQSEVLFLPQLPTPPTVLNERYSHMSNIMMMKPNIFHGCQTFVNKSEDAEKYWCYYWY